MKPMNRLVTLTAAGLLLSTGVAGAEDVLIRAGTVYTMTGPPLKPGAVLVSAGKIAKVAREIDPPAGTRVINLGSGSLMPGLVDACTQLGITGGESEVTREICPGHRVLSAIDWRARDLRAALDQGITTASVNPGTESVFAGLAAVVKTAGSEKTRVVRADSALVLTLGNDPNQRNRARSRPDTIYVRQPTNRMGVIWLLRSTFQKARTTDDPELAAARQALTHTLPVLAVGRTEYDITGALRVGREFGFTPTILGGQEAYKVADQLAEAKAAVILGPLSTAGRSGPERTDIIRNQAGVLYKAGVPCALSCGHLLEQARFAVRFGLPRKEALEAVTVTPARLLGVDRRVGALAPGRDADLLALDGDPLEITTNVRWVMVDGTLHPTSGN